METLVDYNITIEYAKKHCSELVGYFQYVIIDGVKVVMDNTGRVFAKIKAREGSLYDVAPVQQHNLNIPYFEGYNVKLRTNGHDYIFNLKD